MQLDTIGELVTVDGLGGVVCEIVPRPCTLVGIECQRVRRLDVDDPCTLDEDFLVARSTLLGVYADMAESVLERNVDRGSVAALGIGVGDQHILLDGSVVLVRRVGRLLGRVIGDVLVRIVHRNAGKVGGIIGPRLDRGHVRGPVYLSAVERPEVFDRLRLLGGHVIDQRGLVDIAVVRYRVRMHLEVAQSRQYDLGGTCRTADAGVETDLGTLIDLLGKVVRTRCGNQHCRQSD